MNATDRNWPIRPLRKSHTQVRTLRFYLRLPAFICGILLVWAISAARGENWPGWRGPRGDGTSSETNVPLEWSGKEGGQRNIAWKVEIPGHGHASPIVWNDRVFVVTCDEERQERLLLCLDRDTGETLWRRKALRSPLEKKHVLNSFASSTPVTDGQRVYVTFFKTDGTEGQSPRATPGEMVVVAYDLGGREIWKKVPGTFSSMHGYCSSPVLFEDLLIVNGDHDGDGYLVALNKTTGDVVWKIPRENNTRSYCAPLIREIDGRTQMILSGDKCVASYDPRDGSRHWVIDGPTEQFVASLVYNGKLLFLTAGYPDKHMLAIDPRGSGNVTKSHIVWRTREACSYVPSPIAAGNYFLITSDEGIGSCFDSESGKRLWKERLGTHYSGSPVLVDDMVYFTADDGVTKVVRPGTKLDLIAENSLGEDCYTSPAVSQGRLFIRGEKHLYCIGGADAGAALSK
jgi:outer membrane protein assembly factor BamB